MLCMRFNVDLNEAPLLVIWEVTRACALACKHCRASAIDIRHPDELSLEEGKSMLDDIAAMGTPVVVFTGGDPMQRDDLEDLIRYAKSLDLRVGTIPAATPRLTKERLRSIGEAGIDQIAFSLDASTPELHDEFRQVPGSYDIVMQGVEWLHELGISLQINSVISKTNLHDVDALIDKVAKMGVVFWEVFFLVPTGRGEAVASCTADQYEEIFAKLSVLQDRVDFVIKVTEAPHYRRYRAQHAAASTTPHPHAQRGGPKPAHAGRGLTVTRGGINSGKGFAFVDHVGDIQPSGFLPLTCGNIRDTKLSTTYRSHETFLKLRDTSLLEGACGRCRFKETCGGSRARAFALTGNMFAEDRFCVLAEEAIQNQEYV